MMFIVSSVYSRQAAKTIVINEIVTDPQRDWNDSAGGNGVAFDRTPGSGTITDTDEWLELFNAGSTAVDLTEGAGWSIEFINGTTALLNFKTPGSTVLRFSAGGAVTNFKTGEYLVVGNPPGAINNNVFIVLKDASGAVVDDVEIGDDFEGDGNGDGAPDGGADGGNATSPADEAVARVPNAVDTGNDIADFAQQLATIGFSNDSTGTPMTQVKNNTSPPPNGFVLYENHPNPFNPTTKIKFSVPEAATVVLTIHNLKGQELARLFEGELAAGEYQRDWNAAQHVTGIYFARLAAAGKVSGAQVNRVKKMLLAK
ncbi:MAG: lamin tail domain-containing protein [candidate division KSB1 bacterium]|nr:lamin tail domain-containing protein [candidate division KSB1 bacterium]